MTLRLQSILPTSISLCFICPHDEAQVACSGIRCPSIPSSQVRVEMIECGTLISIYSEVAISIVRTAHPNLA